MKYKDRKNAKRKYKQALLATVATMTLGVSTLGSTASVFAAEDTKKMQQAQSSTSVDMAGDFIKLSGQFYYNIIKAANNGDADALQNALRDFVMDGVKIIPVAGTAVASIVGALWTPAGDSAMEKMAKELTTMMDKKVSDLNLDTIKADMDSLYKLLRPFQDEMNGVPTNKSGFYSASTHKTQAMQINAAFIKLINLTAKEHSAVEELPFYTGLTTAYLEFIKYIQQHGVKKLGFDNNDLERYFYKGTTEDGKDKLKTLANDYLSHIEKTANKGQDQIRQKMFKLIKNSNSIEENFQDLSNPAKLNEVKLYSNVQYNKLVAKIDQYKTLRTNMSDLLKTTSGSKAFQTVYRSILFPDNIEIKTGWVKSSDDRYKYISDGTITLNGGDLVPYGQPVTGWIYDKTEWYYLSPEDGTHNEDNVEFKKGEMMIGYVWSGGKEYYLDNPEGNKNFKGPVGRMLRYETATVKNDKGKFNKHTFARDGRLLD
ncbi:hypothetical protein [Bacillus cereus]|uniref:hypothetical protein n=1 Tax=Bacillus cereus TaxID=1396 RepID=UPI0018F740B2|nr:hypothetical protein [Bacillus cereus]MBJ8025762.1 hypothetical protein [Bacillus cereus]MBJ8038146.1 hypothetical protein [Bacillus cereus]